MASRRYLISLLSRSGTPCQRECGCGRIFAGMPQCSQAVVDQCFHSGVLIGDAPGSFPVGGQVFLCLRGFAFEVLGLLPRLPCLHTNRFMSCPMVTDFPEGAAQFCTKGKKDDFFFPRESAAPFYICSASMLIPLHSWRHSRRRQTLRLRKFAQRWDQRIADIK